MKPGAETALGTATVFEAAEGRARVLTGLTPLTPGLSVNARAFTVSATADDSLAVHHAVGSCPNGCVLVVGVDGVPSTATWGEILTTAARARGVVGLVTNGLVRDIARIRALAFPVFALGTSPRGPSKASPGTIGGTVAMLGLEVATGDLVVADDDGVLVVPETAAVETLRRAAQRERREAEILRYVVEGRSTLDALGLG